MTYLIITEIRAQFLSGIFSTPFSNHIFTSCNKLNVCAGIYCNIMPVSQRELTKRRSPLMQMKHKMPSCVRSNFNLCDIKFHQIYFPSVYQFRLVLSWYEFMILVLVSYQLYIMVNYILNSNQTIGLVINYYIQ